jgi:hypothetical protein
MRKFAVALIVGLLVSAGGIGAPVPKAAAASPQLKVVLVVGAVEGTTSSYRADADAAATEFLKFTSNVVKVYSPNATWAAVQAAAEGASILVYWGHGNGYPDPYNKTLYKDRDNGMGLNSSAGNGDSDKKYYGEDYMAQLHLAPNAVVILNHLCYASGNSEPGLGLPSPTTARTRIDGFAAGFLRTNARAVIAEGLGDIKYYIDSLFTPHLTIDSIWKSYPGFHNHVSSWVSSRSPDYTSQMDPDLGHPQSDGDVYYRSLVSLPGFTTDSIGVGVSYAPTTYHPVTPTRILDSRQANNGFAGKLAANRPRTFQVTGRDLIGGGTVPSNASAVTGNLTVTGASSSWAVYLGPDPIAYPSTSTINFTRGETIANGVTVALSSTGSLSATYSSTSGNTTDLVFDLTGYFTPDTSSGNTYHPLATPARIVDSRLGLGLKHKLVANTPAPFPVWLHGNVPGNATAVTGNVTVTGSSSSWAVYVGPDPVASPASSTVNFSRGQTAANNLTVALSATGTLNATFMSTSGNTTDLVFDVTGYYTNDLSGDEYVPISPVREVDSRFQNAIMSKLTASAPRLMHIAGRGGVDANATGISANATVANATHSWAFFLGPNAVAHPGTSTLNFVKGEVRANGLTVALGAGGILYVTYMTSGSNTSDLVLDVTGYFVTPAP